MGALRQSLSWMHTWTGLLFGSVLYFMFLTGAAGYFDTEIDRWMRPEHPKPAEVSDPVTAFETGIAYAEATAPGADSWFIRIPLTRTYSPFIEVTWRGTTPSGENYSGRAELDIRTGEAVPQARETRGGQALYLLHYVFHYMPQSWGQWLAGIASLFMFAAILTGVVIHKKIFKDFFTFRPVGRSRAWLDAHNVTSVMTLPYQIMITFSGLVTLAVFYFPLIVAAHFGTGMEGENRFYEATYGPWTVFASEGEPAELVPVSQVLASAEEVMPGEPFPMITVYNPGDQGAVVEVMGDISASIVRDIPRLYFDGVTGELFEMTPRVTGGSLWFGAVVEGLHEGLFAGPVLRWFFFLSALMGGAMVATGLVLWARKRRERAGRGRSAPAGLAFVERLNVGTIAGLPIAVAAYFWANRLLPVELSGRADWEMHALFIAWALALTHSAVTAPRHGWVQQFAVAAGLFGLLPLINAMTTDVHLGRTLPLFGEGDLVLASIDLSMVAFGTVFAAMAWLAVRRQAPRSKRLATVVKQAAE